MFDLSIWEKIALVALAGCVSWAAIPYISYWIKKNKTQKKDWLSIVIPIILVVGFVLLLISSV